MITSFSGPYRFLSNFYLCDIMVGDLVYPAVENAYQAAKTDDIDTKQAMTTLRPNIAKKLGQAVKLIPNWEEIKLEVMTALVTQKFTVHENLRKKLLATGEKELIEGNWWHDNWYGKCICKKCKGVGENHLGKILMKIRSDCHVSPIQGQ